MRGSRYGSAPAARALRGDESKPVFGSDHTTQYKTPDPKTTETILANAFTILESKRMSIPRTSGGRVIAEPYQIVYYDLAEGFESAGPDAHIKVRFKDLKFSSDGKPLSAGPVIHTKVVLQTQLKEPFSFDLDGPEPQSFVMDFGQGIIPIYVICYEPVSSGQTWAYFIDTSVLRELCDFKAGKRCAIQIFRMDRDLLRYASRARNNSQKSEYEVALDQYAILKRRHRTLIPTELAVCAPTPVPTRHNEKEVRKFLTALVASKISMQKQEPEVKAPREYYIDETLIPFGKFEPWLHTHRGGKP